MIHSIYQRGIDGAREREINEECFWEFLTPISNFHMSLLFDFFVPLVLRQVLQLTLGLGGCMQRLS